MSLKVLIVDDENLSIRILLEHLKRLADLNVVGAITESSKAAELLLTEKIKADISFLDIEMPGMTGLDLAKAIAPVTGIIFTTAHPEYGAASYEVDAIDYLLKPIDFEQVKRSIDRAKQRISGTAITDPNADFIFIKSEGVIVRVYKADIIYLKSYGNDILLFTSGKRYTLRYALGDFLQEKLSPGNFMRVHKSYVINLKWYEGMFRDCIKMKNIADVIHVGRKYRHALDNWIKGQ